MADVLWVLICLANQTGVNLTEALQKNFEKKSIRDADRHQQNDKLTFRAGMFYDETPVRDEYISADLPDGSRLGGTAGLTYRISDKIDIDAAFLYESLAERRAKVNERKTEISAIAGTYRSTVAGFGLGLNFKF